MNASLANLAGALKSSEVVAGQWCNVDATVAHQKQRSQCCAHWVESATASMRSLLLCARANLSDSQLVRQGVTASRVWTPHCWLRVAPSTQNGESQRPSWTTCSAVTPTQTHLASAATPHCRIRRWMRLLCPTARGSGHRLRPVTAYRGGWLQSWLHQPPEPVRRVDPRRAATCTFPSRAAEI